MSERPTDVRMVDEITGESTVCELADLGEDEDGCHVWGVLTPLRMGRDCLTCAVLPPHTALEILSPV